MSEREKLLQDAINTVCGERQDQYGDVEDCFADIAVFWAMYLENKTPYLIHFNGTAA